MTIVKNKLFFLLQINPVWYDNGPLSAVYIVNMRFAIKSFS